MINQVPIVSPNAAGIKPAARDIQETREKAGLTQREAAALVYSTMRTWRAWENGERIMHAAIWELFCLKVLANTSL